MGGTARLIMLILAVLLISSCGGGGSQGSSSSSDSESSEQESTSSAQGPPPGGTTGPQRPDLFTGKHDNLSMGDTADWRSGFHMRLSSPHLSAERPNPQQKRAGQEGAPAVVMQMDIWNDGDMTIPLKSTPCAARDTNGLALKETHLVEEASGSQSIFKTPLEPGQTRSSPVAYVLPSSGGPTMTFKCSLAYATGIMNIMSGPDPPPEATATYPLDTSTLTKS